MDLSKFGEELKKLRLEKQISLMDISFSTRINIKFLEAIEAGKFSMLPQTYVRAFLREYGEAIGAGSEEILRKYDAFREPQSSPPPREAAPPRPVIAPSVKSSQPKEQKGSLALKKNILFAGVLVAAVAFVLFLRFPSAKAPDTIQEIPFDTVVKESEASAFKPDTIASVVIPPPVVVQSDSLHLEMATTDSLWISILVDGKKTLEYLFPPNRRRTFSARDKFSITMGNAGGATFKLNGKELGALGKRGAVVRNVLINEARLKSL
jgi:hypothetical protein